jgi:hypothetical protein
MNANKQSRSARTAVAAALMLCGAAAAHAQQWGPSAHYSGPIPGGHTHVQQVNPQLASPFPAPNLQVPHYQAQQFIPGSRPAHAQPGYGNSYGQQMAPQIPGGNRPLIPGSRPAHAQPGYGNSYGQQLAGAFGVNREGQIAAQCARHLVMPEHVAVCVVTHLTFDELNKCFTDGIGGRGCFGDNNTLVKLIRQNFEAAQRERGAANQVIRATTGISVGDMERYGWKGGPNSEVRKICNFLGC